MDVFMLLDRTGSMAPIWEETVSSVNAYVEALAKDGEDHHLTLAVFDWMDGTKFDVLRDASPIKSWVTFKVDEVAPRGTTPLFDALQRIIALAEGQAGSKDRAAVVVITDGHENASRETTKEAAKASVKRIQDRGWQVVFLGAAFDAFDQAGQFGVGVGQTINVAPGHLTATMRATASTTTSYAATGHAMVYGHADRKASGEAKVTKKKADPTSGQVR